MSGHSWGAMTFLRRTSLTLLCLLAGASGVWAQGKMHASYKVAEKYLRAIHLHQWEEAVDLVETRSLENVSA